jgi:hypothetical protein
LLALPFDDVSDTTKGVLSIEEAYDMVMVPDSRSGFMRISRLISGSTWLGSMSLKKRTLSNASLALLQQPNPNKKQTLGPLQIETFLTETQKKSSSRIISSDKRTGSEFFHH